MRRPRNAAIAAQSDALDAFVIDGIRHNIPFLAALMAHPRWQAGQALHRLHRRGVSCRLSPSPRPRARPAEVIAAVAAAIDHMLGERKRRIAGPAESRNVTRESQRAVWLGEREIKLEVKRENDAIIVGFNHGKRRRPKASLGLEAG